MEPGGGGETRKEGGGRHHRSGRLPDGQEVEDVGLLHARDFRRGHRRDEGEPCDSQFGGLRDDGEVHQRFDEEEFPWRFCAKEKRSHRSCAGDANGVANSKAHFTKDKPVDPRRSYGVANSRANFVKGKPVDPGTFVEKMPVDQGTFERKVP